MITREEFNYELRKACIKYAQFDIARIAILLDPEFTSEQSIRLIDGWLDEAVNSIGPIDQGNLQNEVNLRVSKLILDKARGDNGRGGRRARARAKKILLRALDKSKELMKTKKLFYLTPEVFEKLWSALQFSDMSHEAKNLLEEMKKGNIERPNPLDFLVGTSAPAQQNNIQPQEAQNEHI